MSLPRRRTGKHSKQHLKPRNSVLKPNVHVLLPRHVANVKILISSLFAVKVKSRWEKSLDFTKVKILIIETGRSVQEWRGDTTRETSSGKRRERVQVTQDNISISAAGLCHLPTAAVTMPAAPDSDCRVTPGAATLQRTEPWSITSTVS